MTTVTVSSFNGITSETYEYPMILHELVVNNQGTKPLTVTIGTRRRDLATFTVTPGETFDERVQRFSKVKVEADGLYYGLVRRGEDAFWGAEYLD
jgi:Mg2+ and Co2+ transporter CorA